MSVSDQKDFYYVISPLLLISKVLGLTPFSIKGHFRARKLVLSRSARLYSVILAFITLASHATFLYYLKSDDNPYDLVFKELFMSKTYQTFGCILSSTSFVGLFLFWIKNASYINLLSEFSKFDVKLSEYRHISNKFYEKSRLFVIFLIFINMIFLSLNWLPFAFTYDNIFLYFLNSF